MSAAVEDQYAVSYGDGKVFPEGSESAAEQQVTYALQRADMSEYAGARVVHRTVTTSEWKARVNG